jgi:ornithine--oxo-acid transaminase
VTAAITEQAARLVHVSNLYSTRPQSELAERLAELSGGMQSFFCNSGAEAVETALKLARKWGYVQKGIAAGQAEIITVQGNFHGRTITIVSFSSEPAYKANFGPYTPGFVTVPYADADAIARAVTPNTAAVLIEPIQGEAGVIIPPAGYLTRVAELCREEHVLLMADEIQTGLGRTGRMFACQHEGVRPDVTILGKALGGGVLPVSAVLADRELLGLFQPGEHGSTFGGNPLAAAVGQAALRVIVEEKLVERSAELGEYFQERLAEIPSPHVKEVRGKGLFIGVELKPEAGGARRFCEALQTGGILAKETHEHVIRFAPPLVIDRDTIDWALGPITEVLNMR